MAPRWHWPYYQLLMCNPFIQTVLSGHISTLQQIPGVGKKTAERLIVELSDRLSKFNETQLPFDSVENASTSTASNEHFDEAVSAHDCLRL